MPSIVSTSICIASNHRFLSGLALTSRRPVGSSTLTTPAPVLTRTLLEPAAKTAPPIKSKTPASECTRARPSAVVAMTRLSPYWSVMMPANVYVSRSAFMPASASSATTACAIAIERRAPTTFGSRDSPSETSTVEPSRCASE